MNEDTLYPRSSAWIVTVSILLMLITLPINSSWCTPIESKEDALNDALAHYAQRSKIAEHARATELFAKIAKQYPKDKAIQIWCARTAYYASHRYRDANTDEMKRLATLGHACGQRLVTHHHSDYHAQIWSIMIHFKVLIASSMIPPLGKIETVAQQLEKLTKRTPNQPMGYMLLGAIYRELPGWPISIGDNEHSLKVLKKGLINAKDNAEYLLEVAATYAALDQKKLARETYQKATKGSAWTHLDWERDDARAWAKKMLVELDH